MNTKKTAAFVLALTLSLGFVPVSFAQDPQSSDQQDKDKPTPEKKAILLLDQVVGEAGGLKLPENRIYIQIAAGDLLWVRDEPRARVLFGEAGAGVADMLRRSELPGDPNLRRGNN